MSSPCNVCVTVSPLPPPQNIDYTPFNRFIVEFLDIEPTGDDGIDFGEWLHCMTTVCLFEREEMVRYVFAFADSKQELSIDEEALRKLLKAVFVSARGLGAPIALLASISKLKKDRFGRIPLEEFSKFCYTAPSILFPIARLQQEMAHMALGQAFWSDKKTKYVEQRTLAKRARDMGMLIVGADSDPIVVQSMYLEMLCQQSDYVYQVCWRSALRVYFLAMMALCARCAMCRHSRSRLPRAR